MAVTLADDVVFYTFVHYLCGNDTDARGERRNAPRRPFKTRQYVAPIVRDESPADEAYEPVQCQDIATTGFSYIAPKIPVREKVSVRLGMPDSWLYLSARVARCCAVDTPDGPAVLVGCRFISRE